METQVATFEAFASNIANGVKTATSVGGSYSGIEPMGLVLYLKPVVVHSGGLESKAGLKFFQSFSRSMKVNFIICSDST